MDIEKAISTFEIPGIILEYRELYTGNINRTYEVTMEVIYDSPIREKYIFQEVNTFVFKNPQEVMQNILNVTEHIKDQLTGTNGCYDRHVLSFLKTREGVPYIDNGEQGFWRAYKYIDHARTYDIIHDPYYFYEAGKAFGNFQGQLSNFPAETLYETIPDFHNTVKRMEMFQTSVITNAAMRRDSVKAEIDFIMDRQQEAGTIVNMLANKEIPYRVTHNDTKINNVLFDIDTDQAICVIDLDTVMPGASAYDFGDAVRSGASTAKEDEEDLSKVSFSLELFEKFTKGFIEGTSGLLTPKEIALLPLGAKIITLELASRFLADYLNGDKYFKTTKPHHNLIRARTQIQLVEDMEIKFDKMQGIVQSFC